MVVAMSTVHTVPEQLFLRQARGSVCSLICTCWWHLNTVTTKCHRSWASVKIKDQIVQLGPYVDRVSKHSGLVWARKSRVIRVVPAWVGMPGHLHKSTTFATLLAAKCQCFHAVRPTTQLTGVLESKWRWSAVSDDDGNGMKTVNIWCWSLKQIYLYICSRRGKSKSRLFFNKTSHYWQQNRDLCLSIDQFKQSDAEHTLYYLDNRDTGYS